MVALAQAAVQNSATSSPLTVTLGSPTTAGNCLVTLINSQAATTNSSISGVTLGGVAGNYGSLVTAGSSGDESIMALWCDPNCAGGQTAVSIAFTGGSGALFLSATVMEVSGLALTLGALLDQKSVSPGASSGSSWSSGSSPATAQAAEFWCGMVATDGVTITGPLTVWTNLAQQSGTGASMAGWQVTSSTGTATYNGTFNVSQSYVALVAALLPPASGLPAQPYVVPSLAAIQASCW